MQSYEFSDATFYYWSMKYSGINVSDAKRLKLEDKNNRLVADLSHDKQALKLLLSKKW